MGLGEHWQSVFLIPWIVSGMRGSARVKKYIVSEFRLVGRSL